LPDFKYKSKIWNTNKKFIKRFNIWKVKANGLKPLMDMTLAEMDIFWNEVEASCQNRNKKISNFQIQIWNEAKK
jgi:uncharacterized protein YabN with tetrapyrrole methylase and pyrophosphatase domain